MPLLKLPNELLRSIAENLDFERDISSFGRTNRRLHHLLLDYLYENNIKRHESAALFWAAQHGKHKTVKMMLNKGASVKVHRNYNPLYIASEGCHEEVVQMLLDSNADVNAQGGEYGTALQAASHRGHEKVVQMLLDRDADINARGGYYDTALQAASQGGHEKVVQMLLDRNVNVKIQ
ncbi:hypothetical protein GX50_08674, partial [[Emmonsia] crescens]